MNIILSTDSIRFTEAKISVWDTTEPSILIQFADPDLERTILIRHTKLDIIDHFSIYISITDTSEYFYDHQNTLRKKLTVRFNNETDYEYFLNQYKETKERTKQFKFYSNGTLKCKGNKEEYEEYYNMPGYKIKFKGELDDKDNYSKGTFTNPRQNIQIDFMEIEENIAKGDYNIFFYDNEGDEVYYQSAPIDFKINVACMDVDKFVENMVPKYDDIILRTENTEQLLVRILKNMNQLRDEIKDLQVPPKKTGWFS